MQNLLSKEHNANKHAVNMSTLNLHESDRMSKRG